MKTMAMANYSVIIATALILLQFYCSDAEAVADLCKAGERSEKDKTMCPQERMSTSDGSLPCIEEFCHQFNSDDCEFEGGNKVNNPLLKFTPQMCLTDDWSSPSVGFNFSWTLLAGQANVTGVNILVYHEDYPITWILLKVNLTGHANSESEKNFSTDCLASEHLGQARFYEISVQVLPGEKWYHFPDPFTFNVDCSRPRPNEMTLCGAPPLIRPKPKSFCDGHVEVTANSGPPPGLPPTDTEFKIGTLLCDGPGFERCRDRKDKTVQAIYAEAEDVVVSFFDVEPGIYQTKMAFLNYDGIPCGENFYVQEGNISVNGPPYIGLQAKSSCGTVEVAITANSLKRTLDHQFNVTVILSGVNTDQSTTLPALVTTDPSIDAEDGKTFVYFKDVKSGKYTVTTKFSDQYYAPCSSDKREEVTVMDCSPPTMNMKFWDDYGKFILGVGVLSVFAGCVMFLVHHKWLMRKRILTEQWQTLTEDRGSSIDQLSSIADTTVQERHLHRFLNDTGRGWGSQVDFTNTELALNHQPMSADSGIPSDECETQSWEENESIAFSV